MFDRKPQDAFANASQAVRGQRGDDDFLARQRKYSPSEVSEDDFEVIDVNVYNVWDPNAQVGYTPPGPSENAYHTAKSILNQGLSTVNDVAFTLAWKAKEAVHEQHWKIRERARARSRERARLERFSEQTRGKRALLERCLLQPSGEDNLRPPGRPSSKDDYGSEEGIKEWSSDDTTEDITVTWKRPVAWKQADRRKQLLATWRGKEEKQRTSYSQRRRNPISSRHNQYRMKSKRHELADAMETSLPTRKEPSSMTRVADYKQKRVNNPLSKAKDNVQEDHNELGGDVLRREKSELNEKECGLAGMDVNQEVAIHRPLFEPKGHYQGDKEIFVMRRGMTYSYEASMGTLVSLRRDGSDDESEIAA
ncbi:MAG: hypothetical protein M1834_001120 [Cirrosporium novae-zelandiae]|nr:MAG: hypothetical protein M1834_001120 [Cirrosporium novae-zelandiae]